MSIEVHDVRVPAPGAADEAWEVAATIYLPRALALASGPDILFLLPGAAYGRGYFNLPVPGFSEAMYHAGRGNIVVALDYLGAGESSAPEGATLADAAASTHHAVTYIAARLAEGNLLAGLGPVRYGSLVAAGHSLGGHVVVATQGEHGTFNGIVTLGASVAGTTFPTRAGGTVTDLAEVDYVWVWHWGEVPEVDASVTPTDLATLAGVDVAAGCPVRTGSVPWSSSAVPPYVGEALAPGVSASYAARITSPVLLVAAERDVTRSPEEEAAAFSGSTDVAGFTLPETGHLHTFSEHREQLWKRLDTFVMHASTHDRKVSDTSMAAMAGSMSGDKD
ncbi:hypothetical protein [Nocardioides sp. YIM 152588]|uniref:hypothetical protein n=1 Tax=Nocardioides sp. YIM 152588 TaxID=3158259 RepID=UPI0032E40E2E